MNQSRIRVLNSKPQQKGPILYWMSRDQRVHDNWALIRALELGKQLNQSVAVVFNIVPEFLVATKRHFTFMLQGLQQVEQTLKKLDIPFYLLKGDPLETIAPFTRTIQAGAVITDFSPLHIGRAWREDMAERIDVSLEEVDAHNIVPVWIASQKQEFAAYTLRPRIHKFLSTYLEKYPIIKKQEIPWRFPVHTIPWNTFVSQEASYNWIEAGEEMALKSLQQFLLNGIHHYNTDRNDPNLQAQSNLSPYLHFGQISSQRIALEIETYKIPHQSKEAFLEELIVRKELSDNFCFYNSNYDSVDGFPDWAKKTLDVHRRDKRQFIYSYAEFEHAKTDDELWNAAQLQMTMSGKMHGYMRMYWAKKILEWTNSPDEAMRIAIRLNDTYELDGRDPNGYTGIAWSIGGVHDRAWFDRPIFGKIRYMSYNGAKGKFDIQQYINTWTKPKLI